MRRVGYFLWLVIWLPVDLFRFTLDCWRYVFGWFHYRVYRKTEEQPCIFCQGLDVGMVPRRVSYRIRYRNIWLVKLLQDDLVFMKFEDRLRPRVVCMREGGYLRLKTRVMVLAVFLGFAWNAGLLWVIWVSGVIPDEAKQQLLALLRLEG